MRQRPPWLDEQPEVLALLHGLLDKLDRKPASEWKQPPSLTLDPRRCPALFRLDPAADREWSLLQSLEQEPGILEIRRSRRRTPYDPEFARTRLQLKPTAEPVLRDWLDRPHRQPYPEAWRLALDQAADSFPGDARRLLTRPIRLPGRSAAELLAAFATIDGQGTETLSLRQLSARCFWGQSKFLDQREELVLALFPGLRLQPRPVLINLHLPARPRGLLFIENQDSYTSALVGHPADTRELILVYSAGFRGTALRIRHPEGVVLHYAGAPEPGTKQRLEACWFDKTAPDWPLWFWGDLDFAGMEILKTLRRRFPGLQAWQPGYQPLLSQLKAGHGHPPEADGKQRQTDPGQTGCPYADEILLPALRNTRICVDQESIG